MTKRTERAPAEVPAELVTVDFVALLATFKQLQRKLERLASRLSDMEQWVDDVAAAIESLVRDVSGLPQTVIRRRVRRTPDEERRMRTEARAGATVTIDAQPDGPGEVRLNGCDPFRLSRQLLALLRTLMAAAPHREDGFPGWCSKGELAAALTDDARRPVMPEGVARLMHKLRREFAAAGENVLLIQTNRKLGAWRMLARVDP